MMVLTLFILIFIIIQKILLNHQFDIMEIKSIFILMIINYLMLIMLKIMLLIIFDKPFKILYQLFIVFHAFLSFVLYHLLMLHKVIYHLIYPLIQMILLKLITYSIGIYIILYLIMISSFLIFIDFLMFMDIIFTL